MTKGEEQLGGRDNKHVLENVVEAILGAMYFDGGIEPTKKFVQKYWSQLISEQQSFQKDPKTRLQEWLQKHKRNLPSYKIVGQKGEKSNSIFVVEVFVDKTLPSIVTEASNKKDAEILAAKELISYIQKHVDKNI